MQRTCFQHPHGSAQSSVTPRIQHPLLDSLGTACTWCTYRYARTHTHRIKTNKYFLLIFFLSSTCLSAPLRANKSLKPLLVAYCCNGFILLFTAVLLQQVVHRRSTVYQGAATPCGCWHPLRVMPCRESEGGVYVVFSCRPLSNVSRLQPPVPS